MGGLRAARADGSAGSARHLHEPIPRFQGERPERASLRPERTSLRPVRLSAPSERATRTGLSAIIVLTSLTLMSDYYTGCIIPIGRLRVKADLL